MSESPELQRVVTALTGITHCDNCGCSWLDDGINPIGCPYCKQPPPSSPALTALVRELGLVVIAMTCLEDRQAHPPCDYCGENVGKQERGVIERAIAALRSSASRDQGETWQPIETAPKDGREILIQTVSFNFIVVRWDVDSGLWSDGEYTYIARCWCPLPPPPSIPDGPA